MKFNWNQWILHFNGENFLINCEMHEDKNGIIFRIEKEKDYSQKMWGDFFIQNQEIEIRDEWKDTGWLCRFENHREVLNELKSHFIRFSKLESFQ